MKYVVFIVLLTISSIPSNAQCSGGGNQNGGLGGDSSNANVLQQWTVEEIRSGDPNQITGNKGYTQKQWVSIHEQLGYTIEFENDGNIASGDAQNVVIHFPVPTNAHININSFRLGNFGFGKYNFQVPPNTTAYINRLDFRDSLNLYVNVTAGIDIVNNEFFWIINSIDPLTGKTPIDGRGFLPITDTGKAKLSDTTYKGRGYVSFYANPQSYLATGDTVAAQASITFDINDPVPTNVWENTIDAVAPASHITKADTAQNIITLHWSGKDDPGGSGVRDYDLYVSDSGNTFTLYKSKIDSTSTTFKGTPGDTYRFFTIATDTVGNKETLKKSGDITVSLTEAVLPVKWLYFQGQQQNEDALLNWGTVNEINTKNFIIERSLDGRMFLSIGTVNAINNNAFTNNYNFLDKNAMLQKTKMLYYRLREVDLDGRYVYSGIIHIPLHQSDGEPTIKAYPNPFGQSITLKVLNITATDKTNNVSLYSIEGKQVYTHSLGTMGSSIILLQDLPVLSPGIYILSTVINGKIFTIKMVKSN